jgi:membrane fusion protein (multidrug efflux system)
MADRNGPVQGVSATRGSRVALQAAALSAAAFALGLTACGKAPQGGFPGGFSPAVTVQTLKAGPVALTRELPGRTSPYQVADVRPQVGGIVRERLFTEGSVVHAGQPLYQLDDAIYRAQLGSAQAALARAEAAAHAARLAADRSGELLRTQLVSRQDNDSAVANAGQADAEVAGARAALDTARVNLSYARISAPISGRIGRSTVTAGALVTANQAEALATISQLDPIYVDVSQASSEWLPLRRAIAGGSVRAQGPGTPVRIVLEDGSAYAREGKLQFSDVTVDASTGNFLLRVLVPNPDGLLLPGMYVRAVLTEGLQPQGLLAPQGGIQHDPRGNATALVVGSDGKVAQRELKLGRAVGDRWLVESGLAAGDRLIISGLQKVQPGMPVQATEAGAEPAATQPAAAPPAAGAK